MIGGGEWRYAPEGGAKAHLRLAATDLQDEKQLCENLSLVFHRCDYYRGVQGDRYKDRIRLAGPPFFIELQVLDPSGHRFIICVKQAHIQEGSTRKPGL